MTVTLNALEKIVRTAGALALTHFNDLQHLEILQKSPRDFVTAADVTVEKYLQKTLSEQFPEYGFWGEESGKKDDQAQRWVVDPIDGTHSFAKGQYYWSISVALEVDGELLVGAVYAPALDDYYCAAQGEGAFKNGKRIKVSSEPELANSMIGTGFACLRSYLEDNNLERFCRIAQRTTGQRRLGSAAMDLCLVADGQLDAFWEQELNLYDIAAGVLIVREAGGTVTNFKGEPGIDPKQILVSNGKVLAELLTLM